MKHSVYDFDKTIYDGDSTVDFYKYCVKAKPAILLLLPSLAYAVFLYFFKLKTLTELKENFFKFLSKMDSIDESVNEFWTININKTKDFYQHNKQVEDIIISASPEFLLLVPCRMLGIEYLIASKVDKYTGKFMGLNCKGEEKVRRLKSEYPDAEINKFYSDSLSDSPLAEIADEAFFVKKNQIEPWPFKNLSVAGKIKKNFFTRDFLLFVLCGGIGTLTNFVFSLVISMQTDPVLAYALSYGISLFVTYTLNAKLIFTEKLSGKDFVKFVISYIPNFAILFSFVFVFINILAWNKVIVYALAGLLGLPLTYIIVKVFTFNRKRD